MWGGVRAIYELLSTSAPADIAIQSAAYLCGSDRTSGQAARPCSSLWKAWYVQDRRFIQNMLFFAALLVP